MKPARKNKTRDDHTLKSEEELLPDKKRYAAEFNEAISLTSHDDFLQNHTLEDEFVKV